MARHIQRISLPAQQPLNPGGGSLGALDKVVTGVQLKHRIGTFALVESPEFLCVLLNSFQNWVEGFSLLASKEEVHAVRLPFRLMDEDVLLETGKPQGTGHTPTRENTSAWQMKTKRIVKRICAFLLCFSLLAGLLPMTALAAENVPYIFYTYEGSTLTPHDGVAGTATEVTASDQTWDSGWYVVSGNVTIPSRVTVTGDVCLILADDCTLDANAGIEVANGNSLTIYGQENGSGILNTTAPSSTRDGTGGSAGIGQTGATIGWAGRSGEIAIHGGIVTAKGGNKTSGGGGAGIGGGGSAAKGIGGGAFATGANSTAVIFASSISDNDNTTSWCGLIFAQTEGKIYGGDSFAVSSNLDIPEGYTLTIEEGKTLTINSGSTLTVREGAMLTVEGTLTNNGTLSNNGTIIDNGTLSGIGSGDVRYPSTLAVTLSPSSAAYGGNITITATVTADSNFRGDISNDTVTFCLGDARLGIGTLANTGSCTYTASLTETIENTGNITWSVGSSTNIITAQFSGVAGSGDTHGLAASTGTATLTLNKGTQSAVPSAPSGASSVSANSVTLNAVTGDTTTYGTIQYGYTTGDETSVLTDRWQTGMTFNNLQAGTAYTFYTRFAGLPGMTTMSRPAPAAPAPPSIPPMPPQPGQRDILSTMRRKL
ncbi:fibronectin type III domain-containing protein [uncultured Pseudoflavonifractor sp.]|uniref:fibronectin type III domain-containing protein n=1 Tax=uncultured Pseudoflavonifractor sp. TaxID=1221379 RepID=UPI0025F4FC1C|nr:fibronectin type III domain-containing protein [uncultured Pseudoflavonifractor sp.]